MSGLIPKAEFLGIENIAHLAAGGEAPVLLDGVTAIHRFLIDKGAGMPGRERMAATAGQTRKRLARLLGASADEIALLWNATAGLHTILMGIDWRPGDNIVVAASEFISLLTVWHHCGAELRKVGTETHATLDDVANAIDARTRLIVVSHVSYLTGARINIAAVRDLADLYGARFVVDASHSLGVVTVDGSLCDAIVSCCYKWLFGMHGVGVFFVNATRWPDLQPAAIGWNSVVSEEGWRYGTNLALKSGMSRFECGNLSFMSIYYLESGLAKLEKLGIASIEGHVLELGGELRAGLARLNLSLLTPEAPEQRAGNICFATNRCVELEAHLRARGILTWGDDGRLRISVHAYNDSSDIERVLKELQVMTA